MNHHITEHKLQGGSKLLYIQTPGASSSVITLNVRSGYRFVPYELYELPHVAEHIFFESNQKYVDALDLNRAIKRNGAYANAYTNFSRNWYELVVAADEVDSTLELFGDFINLPNFSQAAIDKEIRVIRDELNRNRENYGRLCNHQRSVKSRPGVIKDWESRIADLEKITSSAMTDFYERFYAHENSTWVIAGPTEPDGIVAKINLIMAPYAHGAALEDKVLEGYASVPLVYTERPLDQVHIGLAFERDRHYDRAETPVMALMSVLTGVHDIGDLSVDIRKRGLAYGIGTGDWQSPDDSGFSFGLSCGRDNAEAVIDVIIEHITRLRSGMLTEADLERGKRYMVGTWRRSYDTPGSLLGAYRGEYVEEGIVTTLERRAELVEAVTLDDITRVSSDYFRPKFSSLSLVGRVDESTRSRMRSAIDQLG